MTPVTKELHVTTDWKPIDADNRRRVLLSEVVPTVQSILLFLRTAVGGTLYQPMGQ